MNDLIQSLKLAALSLTLCCVVYPAIVLALGQAFVPTTADGSLVVDDSGHVIGSTQIAQGFTRPEYFWPRPSAVDYNAAATGGSNLSPANSALTERALQTIEQHGAANLAPIPADLVAASGSGVDPHITLAAAQHQLARVAAARGLPQERIVAMIEASREGGLVRVFGGEPVVNVLMLNMSLDQLTRSEAH